MNTAFTFQRRLKHENTAYGTNAHSRALEEIYYIYIHVYLLDTANTSGTRTFSPRRRKMHGYFVH